MDKKGLITIISTLCFVCSCVSPRVVEDLKVKNERCQVDNATLKTEIEKLTIGNTEMSDEVNSMKKSIGALEKDTALIGRSLRKMTEQYDKINDLQDVMIERNKELLTGNREESEKLLKKLIATEEDLQKREDQLKDLGRALDQKKENLEMLNGDLKKMDEELKKREMRVNELEEMIQEKDAIVSKLKEKVSAALFSFKDKGISVEQKNGKVYVSLEAKLLFAKGSTVVDPEGKKALKELAKVLKEQKDIEVIVEGHTDTDAILGGSAIKDNWDLSVLRATSVIRILSEDKNIDPKRITASGKSEFYPVDPADNEKAKSKNRRIEIILNPKLEELYRIIGEKAKE